MSIPEKINKIIHYFQRPQKTATMAKERLQIIIAHERSNREKPDFLDDLQRDILAVVAKYVDINNEEVKVELECKPGCSILELNVMLPTVKEVKVGVV